MSRHRKTSEPWLDATGRTVAPLGEAVAEFRFPFGEDVMAACHAYMRLNHAALEEVVALAMAMGHAPDALQLEMECIPGRVVALPRNAALVHRRGDDGSQPSAEHVPVLVLGPSGGFWLSHAFRPRR